MDRFRAFFYIGISNFAYDLTTGIETGTMQEQTTDPKGGITQKVYDKSGRLVRVIDAGKTTSFGYYDNGNRKSVTYLDGSKIQTYAYDLEGRITYDTNRTSPPHHQNTQCRHRPIL